MVLLNNDNQQAFGDNIKQEFQLDPKLTHLNNGSFGTVPKSVRESRIKWLDAIESHPDLLLLGPLQQNLQKPLKRIANIIGANPEDVVFIKNATQGINVVLRSLELTEKDTLFYFNTAYNSVNVLIQFLNEKQGVNLIEFRHKPVSDRQLIESVKQAIEQAESNGIKITVAVLDAIISVPGLILPYEELAILFKEHGAKVVVDGAHAFGQIKLNIAKTKVDFFSTTLHKWGYAYRPTSVLYVRKEYQSIIHPTVIAVGYGSNNFQTTFQWPGTIDFSCWLATDASLDFIEKYGQDNIINYIHNLAWEGGQRVAKLIGGKVLGEEHQSGNMVNIELPFNLDNDKDYGALFANYIWEKYHYRIKCFYYENQWYLRLSGQLFLTLEHFESFGKLAPNAITEFKKSLNPTHL